MKYSFRSSAAAAASKLLPLLSKLLLLLLLVSSGSTRVQSSSSEESSDVERLTEKVGVMEEFMEKVDQTMEKVLTSLESLNKRTKNLEKWNFKIENRVKNLTSTTNEVKEEEENQVKEIDTLKNRTSDLLGQLTQFFVDQSDHSSDESNQQNEQMNTGRRSFDDKQQSTEVLELKISATGGTTYVRWGRTVCSGDAKRLYHGYMAGSRHNMAGGGANVLCLHSDPEWRTVGIVGASTSINGIEFIGTSAPFSSVNNGGETFGRNDIPCVLCHTEIRTHQVMIPGRASCPAGWTLEYWGYLSSSHDSQQKSTYYCMDEAPEVVPNTSAAATATYAYAVYSHCAALQCPPYREGSAVTCVVCSR